MKKNKLFAASCVFCGLNFVVLIGYLLICLAKSYIVHPLMFSIPAVAFLLSLLFIVIKKIPNVVKLIFTILIFLGFTSVFCFFDFAGGHREFRKFEGVDEIKAYNEKVSESDYSPNDKVFEIEKYGDYEEITAYKYHCDAIFSDRAFTTLLKYNDSNFAKEKEKINQQYEFYDAPVEEGEGNPVFTKDGFDFRVRSDSSYPKLMYFIGINENTKEIVYIDFSNYDLDIVSDFEDFLDVYCRWDKVK